MQTSINRIKSAISTLCLAALSILSTHAYQMPPVNLGSTSFIDGMPPAGPGLYYQHYLVYYTADSFKDNDGNDIAFASPNGAVSPEIDVWSSVHQLIYLSEYELFGGKLAIDLILPVVNFDLNPGDLFALQDNSAGIGDLLVGPTIQWDPIMGENGPIFVQRVELQLTFPTGRYDSSQQLNPGTNTYTISPYWVGTYFFSPKWTASLRLHYLWNSKNDDIAAPGIDSIQGGQAFHANFATAYEVLPHRLRLGINGYYLKQFTDSKFNGVDTPGTREQVFAIGPGALWSFSKDDHLFFNAYFETAVRNRPQGSRFIFRWAHHF